MHLFKKIVLLSYVSIASAEAAMLTPAFPVIQQYFQLNTSKISLLMTFFMLGYMLCQPIFGPLANRLGCLNSLRIGFLLNLLALILGAVASLFHLYDWVLVSRFLSALGAGMGLSGTFTLIHKFFQAQEAKSMISFVVLSFMLGIGLGVYLGGLLVQYINWLAIWLLMFAYSLLLLLSTFLFKEPQHTILTNINFLKAYRACIKNRRFLAYTFAFASINMSSQLYATAAPLISAYVLHLDANQYGKWNLLIMLGMLIGSLHGRKLFAKHSMHQILRLGLLGIVMLICGAFILFYLTANTLLFFIFALLLYYFGGIIYPCASYCAMQNLQDHANASSVMNFISMLIASTGLLLLGYLPLGISINFFILLIIGTGLALLIASVEQRQ